MSQALRLPADTPTSTFFVDESGAKGSGGSHFVVAAVKSPAPDELGRAMQHLRNQYQFHKDEFHFSKVTRNTLPIYRELVDLLVESDAVIGASVVDKAVFDPFSGFEDTWEAHAWVTAALVKAMTSRKELITVLVDSISTPRGVAYGAELQAKVNRDFRATRVVAAVSLDSCTCDGLQLADLVASAIAHQRTSLRTMSFDEYASQAKSHKAQLAMYLSTRLGAAGFPDWRTGQLNIRTFQGAERPLSVRDKAPTPDLRLVSG